MDLRTSFGVDKRANTPYNVLIGIPCLNSFGGIVSPPHLAMKYPASDETISTFRADQKVARECYVAGLRVQPLVHKREGKIKEVVMADLDPRVNVEERMKPLGGTRPFRLGKLEGQDKLVGIDLTSKQVNVVGFLLKRNHNLFAWTTSDMPGIHFNVISHNLAIFKEARPMAQKKRRMGEEKRKAMDKEVKKLLEARFIREIKYNTWLANVVMVKKSNS